MLRPEGSFKSVPIKLPFSGMLKLADSVVEDGFLNRLTFVLDYFDDPFVDEL